MDLTLATHRVGKGAPTGVNIGRKLTPSIHKVDNRFIDGKPDGKNNCRET